MRTKVEKLYKKISPYIPIIILFGLASIVLAVSLRMTYSRYTNFENGKFDLGNMVQMVWNTMNGRFMQLTDYFGTNMPRWGMSHVDPLLLIFIPFMAIFKTPLVLVWGQLVFVIFSSVILFKIAELELKNKWASLFIAASYLFYPAIGYILAWTDFHGVTASMPFFFGAFYAFEKMYKDGIYNKKRMVTFWILLVLSMLGKEEISLFVLLFGLFIFIFRNNLAILTVKAEPLISRIKKFLSTRISKISIPIMVVSFIWFVLAFFVIIPNAAHYRVESYNSFIESIGIEAEDTVYVTQSNYFLKRYDAFGDSYLEVLFNMIIHPRMVMEAWTDGAKPMNFMQTFTPVLFLPLLYPPIFMIAIPELIINYSRVSGGVSTTNIENHRISLIVVVMFIAIVYGLKFIAKLLKRYLKISETITIFVLSLAMLVVSINKTFEYKNPVFLWLKQSVERRIVPLVSAEENIIKDEEAFAEDLQIGEGLKLVRLERKDRDCAQRIAEFIPDNASVSGPDYMGAKLAMRETYALFPALFDEADYVIADVYARKISSVLDIESVIANSAMGKVLMSPNYTQKFVCGNMAVFERGGPYDKPDKLPIQSVFDYEPTIDVEIFRNIYLRDFSFPEKVERQEFAKANFAYEQKSGKSLDAHKLFTTFVNKETAEYYQAPHLPSYSLMSMRDWHESRYYTEEVDFMIPSFMDTGIYRVFVGLTDGIETRSVYIGEIEVY